MRIACLAFFMLPVLAALSGCSSAGVSPGCELNVASFNVGFCKEPSDVPVWNRRKALIMPLVEYHDFDIVGMQEPFGFQVDYLAGASSRYAVAGDIVRDLALSDVSEKSAASDVDRMLRNMNNPIFYKKDRFLLLKSGKFYFSDTPDRAVRGFGKSFDSIRSCVWAEFRDRESGAEFYFFNLHLCVSKFKEWHRPAAELLVRKIAEIAGNSPFFITGDFNETRNDEANVVLRSSGMVVDARQHSASRPYGVSKSTFHGYKNVSEGDLPIDFIYVSKGIKVLKFGTLSDSDCGVSPSDHYPIVAHVKLAGK